MKKDQTMMDVIKFHISVFKKDKEGYMIWVFLLNMIVTGTIPLVAVVFPRYIIDAISTGDLRPTLLYIGIYGFVSLALSMIRIRLGAIVNGRFVSSRLKQNRVYNEKFKNVSMTHLEDANFHAKRNEAFETMDSNNNGFQGTLQIVYHQLPELFSIIGFIIILGLFNPMVLVVAFGCSIIQFFLALKAKQFVVNHHKDLTERSRISQYFYNITHDFAYGKDIRINSLSEPILDRYVEKSNSFLALLKRKDLYEYRFNVFDVFFLLITNGIAYYLVIQAYFDGLVTIGTISMAIMTVLAITVKLQATFKELARLKEETARTKKYIAFFNDDYYFEQDTGEEVQLPDITIEFQHVSFKYPSSDQFVLHDVSFTVSVNEKLALVGINGSGKSTIVKLLCGFYVPTSGDILINGINTKTMNIPAYQKHIAVVFQEVNLYAGTIVENITGPNPTDEQRQRAIQALSQAGLLEKVMGYEKKEDQPLLKIIEADGVDFSGGEAQKLAIARAIYKEHTKLIILDEPTAALDAIAEKRIYEQFNELVHNQTALMISHRLASTKFCDNIIFLEYGEIIESGTHDTLMELPNGKYRDMFTTQGKYYKNEGVPYEN